MSYQKQNFANGEVLSASQLNHIENGIADAESAANATKTVVDKIIDPTLSLSGKAADAKATGDVLKEETERAKGVESQLKEDIVNTNNFDAVVIFKDSKLPNATNNGFTIAGSSGFFLSNLSNQRRIEYNFSDIASELPDVTTWNENTKTFTLTLGSEQQFGVDLLTGKVQTAPIVNKRSASFLSLYWVYYNQYGGKIFEDCAAHYAELVNPLSNTVRFLSARDFDVILTNSTKIERIDANGFALTGDNKLYIANFQNKSRTTYMFEDIAAKIGSTYVLWDADSKTFSVNLNGGEKRFGFNLDSMSFEVQNTLGARPDNFVVLYWVYYNRYGGKIFEDCAAHYAELVNPLSNTVRFLSARDFDVILTNSTKIERIDANGFALTGDNKLYIANFQNKSRTTYMFEDIAAKIGSTYVLWDADSKTFSVNLNGGEKRFGFNLDSMSFEVQNTLGARPDNFVVLYWVYYNRYGGKILESYSAIDYNDKKESYLLSDEFQRDDFNASYHTGAKDFYTVCKRYSSLFNGDEINNVVTVNRCEAFLWFTDPHLFTAHTDIGSEPMMEEYVSQIQKYYNSTPTSFVLCGGDWLGNNDVPEMACYKMGYIDGIRRSMFDNLYMLVGNHDTNYQGKKDANSEKYTTRLSRVAIRNLWYRDTGRAYYDFKGVNTHFYCFDTGIENQALTYDNNYGYEQAAWFAENLTKERFDHVAIAVHIYSYRTIPTGAVPDDVQPLTRLLLQISSAYNRRSEISVNGKNYNFVDATGRVEFMLAGHSHADYTLVDSGIPIIATLDCGNNQSYKADCSFDLVFVDYDNRKIKCIRAGVGEDREINLDS